MLLYPLFCLILFASLLLCLNLHLRNIIHLKLSKSAASPLTEGAGCLRDIPVAGAGLVWREESRQETQQEENIPLAISNMAYPVQVVRV